MAKTRATAEPKTETPTRATPSDHSQPCRKCGTSIAFDDIDDGGAIACPSCGSWNVPGELAAFLFDHKDDPKALAEYAELAALTDEERDELAAATSED